MSRRVEDCSSKQFNTENPKSSQYLCYNKKNMKAHKQHKMPTQEIPHSLSSKMYLSPLNSSLSPKSSLHSLFFLPFVSLLFVKESLLYSFCTRISLFSFIFLKTEEIAARKMFPISSIIVQLPATA